jgi:arsenate reductase
MSEYIIKKILPDAEVYSAGVKPASRVNPLTIKVMEEDGYDMTGAVPKHSDQVLKMSFDYVITVCDHANETCPVFMGEVKNRLHKGFEDPDAAQGSEEEKLVFFRKIREQIKEEMTKLFKA